MDDRPPDVRFEFDNEPEAPRKARRALSSMLTDPNDQIVDAVQLTTSELVTNVVLHTTSAGVVQAWDPKPDVPLRVEVEDHDPNPPVVTQNPAVGGRGLTIVAAVADEWGIEPTSDGKIVWAEFNRRSDR